MTSTDQKAPPKPRRYVWERYGGKDMPDGADLASLRRGLGKAAGEVPAMWRFYTTLRADGALTAPLQAEHATLCLFALHQQAQSRLMHQAGIGFGTAVARLRSSGKFSAEAVDGRFVAAATATSFTEITAHLRGLVTQLRTIGQPLDYTRLLRNLQDWQDPGKVHAVRRWWGSQYYTMRNQPDDDVSPGGAPTEAADNTL